MRDTSLRWRGRDCRCPTVASGADWLRPRWFRHRMMRRERRDLRSQRKFHAVGATIEPVDGLDYGPSHNIPERFRNRPTAETPPPYPSMNRSHADANNKISAVSETRCSLRIKSDIKPKTSLTAEPPVGASQAFTLQRTWLMRLSSAAHL
jgi:hypothetical protein